MIRPVIEYGSEVWGDACNTTMNKLDSIEHKALTTALGVPIYSKRSEVNIEAGVVPLRIRMIKKWIKTYIRNYEMGLGIKIRVTRYKRLGGGQRSSFNERAELILEEAGVTTERAILMESWKSYII